MSKPTHTAKIEASDKYEQPLHITFPALHQASVIFVCFRYIHCPKLGCGSLVIVIDI
jgi:ABC-type sugar transport system permease subunit